MGAKGSSALEENSELYQNVSVFANDVQISCVPKIELQDAQASFDKYVLLWDQIETQRKTDGYDARLWKDTEISKYILGAIRKRVPEQVEDWIKLEHDWRVKGIRIVRTFFHLPEVRRWLVRGEIDFLTHLLVIFLPDENDDDDADDDEAQRDEKERKAAEQDDLQCEAVAILSEMAEYEEFMVAGGLCSTAVLNFLCIVLNQVPKATESVTNTFAKLARKEENLIILMEGSVGDILESFFKTVGFKAPTDDDPSQIDERASLSNCANVLGTLIKFNHQMQISLPTIIEAFKHITAVEKLEPGVAPDVLNLRLLAEMSRLFYWICRRAKDPCETLREAGALESTAKQTNNAGTRGEEEIDGVLNTLHSIWEKCVKLHNQPAPVVQSRWGSDEQAVLQMKIQDCSDMALCHMNCLLWVLLPERSLRWKLKSKAFENMDLAFDLNKEEYMKVTIGTARHLADMPNAQQCVEFIQFLGEQMLRLLELALDGQLADSVVRILLDTLSILAMQRGMQEMFAEYLIWDKLNLLLDGFIRRGPDAKQDPEIRAKFADDVRKQDLAILRTHAEVAMHPGHRLNWVYKKDFNEAQVYPPRDAFEGQLEKMVRDKDDNFKTMASLLLTVFQEDKFRRSVADIENTFKSVLDWWEVNTTSRYEKEDEVESQEGVPSLSRRERSLQEVIQIAHMRKEERRALTSMETLRYCAPHECVLALTLFSRLALEPKFKILFYDQSALKPILECVCVGIWPEAREAAAVLANLMWMPDLDDNQRLVCWLKFDSPKCIAVDGANVLLPINSGTRDPRPADIGKGMYQSSWGVEFIDGSVVSLHPDGFKTYEIPGILTTASPNDTFTNTKREYDWLDDKPDPKHFSLTCWFYWPPTFDKDKKKSSKVLVQSTDKISQVYLECEQEFDQQTKEPIPVWTVITYDEHSGKRTRRPVKTPKLNPGWHLLGLVSSTSRHNNLFEEAFDGTKFYLDDWHTTIPNAWVQNNFYLVGNDGGADGKKPFGLITDFRIYARVLPTPEIKAMVAHRGMEHHPSKIVRRIAEMGAAQILAERLDVPDSAAECLRALGSLATLSSERAKIYSVCGREVLKMLDSPLPAIQRYAARLLNNIA